MIMNTLTITGIILFVVLWVWLAIKAQKIQRGIIKWPLTLIPGLLALAGIVITATALLGFYRLNFAPYQYPARDLMVEITPERVARGEKLAIICTDCHSSTGKLPLDGSKGNILAGDLPLGNLYATNLTPGGPLKDWTDAEILRAMREGVNRKGQPLITMPSQALHYASDEDAAALIAYIRSQPEVNRELPEKNLTVLAAILVGAGMFPTSAQPPIFEPVVAPPYGTIEYGEYQVASLGCRDCHGQDLAGMAGGIGPSGSNLTASVTKWERDEFISFFRTGKDPAGRYYGDVMPWKVYGQAMSDEDLELVYLYLNSLTPIVKTVR